MKKQSVKTIIALLFLTSITLGGYAQKRFNISTGVGITEGLNLGLRYQFKQSQIGVTAGTSPYEATEQTGTIGRNRIYSASYYYHFAGKSRLSDRKPLYAKTGISYYRSVQNETLYEQGTFNLCLGSEINLSRKAGFNVSAGAYFALLNDTDVTDWFFAGARDYPYHLALDASFFYRIGK